jgi:hypothetical protein
MPQGALRRIMGRFKFVLQQQVELVPWKIAEDNPAPIQIGPELREPGKSMGGPVRKRFWGEVPHRARNQLRNHAKPQPGPGIILGDGSKLTPKPVIVVAEQHMATKLKQMRRA